MESLVLARGYPGPRETFVPPPHFKIIPGSLRKAGLEKLIERWGGLGLGSPRGKGSPSVSKGPELPMPTTIVIAEKQSKRSKKGSFCYKLGPPGPTQEMEFMGPGGEGPSRSPAVSPAMV